MYEWMFLKLFSYQGNHLLWLRYKGSHCLLLHRVETGLSVGVSGGSFDHRHSLGKSGRRHRTADLQLLARDEGIAQDDHPLNKLRDDTSVTECNNFEYYFNRDALHVRINNVTNLCRVPGRVGYCSPGNGATAIGANSLHSQYSKIWTKYNLNDLR